MSDTDPLSKERVPDLAYVWRDLSELVQASRTTPIPAGSNKALQHQVDNDPDGPLAPPLLLWMGDNLMMETRFEDAVAAFGTLIDRFPERRFGETTWAVLASERIAECYERLGRPEDAFEVIDRMIETGAEGRSPAQLCHRAGQMAESAGLREAAMAWYERSAASKDAPREAQTSIPDLARRDLERLTSETSWMRADPVVLAKELAYALETGSEERLMQLASPTHFSLGVLNGERVFVDRKALLEVVSDNLGRSRVRSDPIALEGSGDKRYLATEGWNGSFLQGRVVLLLSRTVQGWQWTGAALTRFPDADWEPLLGPPRFESNQPLTLSIKAPWVNGVSFRAGGIVPFAAQILGCLAAGPFAPWCLAAMSANPCGFGPGGLYYGGVLGNNFTHGGDDFFAIDFARFVPGVPFANATVGTPVRAVQTGMVSGVRSSFGRGSEANDNRVLVKHMTEAEFILIVIIELLSGRSLRPLANPRFTSMHLHLDGPFRIPVSPGMFVRQGAFLGPMDDTGLSVDHHLHFSIHDNTLPAARAAGPLTPAGRSVRPNPMDGLRLIEADDGRCVSSTNV